jgi:hypothetical protein
MKTSGVARFLSRRDKHHEKRSKAQPSKVRPCSSASCNSLTPLLPSPHSSRCARRRPSQGLEILYHKLPSALRSSVGDSCLFFYRNTSTRSSFTPIAQSTPHQASNDLLPQLRPPNDVSPNLYTIFTNEERHPAADKDADKKVRRCPGHVSGCGLTVSRSRCSSRASRVPA